jgi:dUTP pyrophosphatase
MKINYQTNKYHPTKKHDSDAAWDLYALEDTIIPARGWNRVHTGIRMSIPAGYAGLIMSRSGLASRGLYVLNAPGVIDAGYSGEIQIILASLLEKSNYEILAGDRIAQLMIVRLESYYFSPGVVWGGDRGENGFGSTGD